MLNPMSITTGITTILILTPLAILIYMLIRNQGEAILCMECQQCRAVCPVLSVDGSYIGPKDIMVAAKSGKYDDALRKKMKLCADCATCMERCPRKLEVGEANREIFAEEIKSVLSRDTIDYARRIPNPKMQRTYEAVIRRFEGKKINIPWEWINKSHRLRNFYNVVDERKVKPKVTEREFIIEGGNELKQIKAEIFDEELKPGPLDELFKEEEKKPVESKTIKPGEILVNNKIKKKEK